MARIETVAIQADNANGFIIINKSDVKEGNKVLSEAQLEKKLKSLSLIEQKLGK